MNQKVVTQNFIIEQIGDKYFNLGILFSNSIWTWGIKKYVYLYKIEQKLSKYFLTPFGLGESKSTCIGTKLNKSYPSRCIGNQIICGCIN